MTTAVTYLEQLRDLAIDQYGFVATAQAESAGIPRFELAKMVARNRIERVAHGVYRIPQVQETEYDQFMQAILWTGAPEAVLSHDTAIALREISDINPTKIHMTVKKDRRIKRASGNGYALHFEDIPPEHVTWFARMPIVDVSTAIKQCIESGVPGYLIEQAITNAGKTSDLPKPDRLALAKLLKERNVKPCQL
jgi:predicted transcriptional regulator of viral defense system